MFLKMDFPSKVTLILYTIYQALFLCKFLLNFVEGIELMITKSLCVNICLSFFEERVSLFSCDEMDANLTFITTSI